MSKNVIAVPLRIKSLAKWNHMQFSTHKDYNSSDGYNAISVTSQCSSIM